MIARIWRGWAPLATADDYQRHYETEVSGHLRAVSGFRGARLLRRDDGPEIMFTSITFFTSLDAIRGFAGDDYELAVVEETAPEHQRPGTRRAGRTREPDVTAGCHRGIDRKRARPYDGHGRHRPGSLLAIGAKRGEEGSVTFNGDTGEM